MKRSVQPEVAGGLKVLVKEVEGLHYLFSETNVLNSEEITDKLICIFFLHMLICYRFFVYLLLIFPKSWHIPKIDISIPYPF